MFAILVYDVNQKRVAKVMKVCRKYLTHVQRSVFEGNITEAKLNKLKRELGSVIDYDDDAICIYTTLINKSFSKEQIGVSEVQSNII